MRLSKLGTALTVVFVISIIALVAELYYVFRRRRSVSAAAATSSSASRDEVSVSSSKELLYFFCIESSEASNSTTAIDNARIKEELGENSEVIDIDLFKIGGAFGPTPKFLFTIKEEEREGLDSPKEVIVGAKKLFEEEEGEEKKKSMTTLAECFEVVEIEDDDGDDVESATTSFSTPYDASPVFFTPSESPVDEHVQGRALDGVVSSQKFNFN